MRTEFQPLTNLLTYLRAVIVFTARLSYARAVLEVVILSVSLFVRLSVCHTRALWQNQTMHCGYFDKITLDPFSKIHWPRQCTLGRRKENKLDQCFPNVLGFVGGWPKIWFYILRSMLPNVGSQGLTTNDTDCSLPTLGLPTGHSSIGIMSPCRHYADISQHH